MSDRLSTPQRVVLGGVALAVAAFIASVMAGIVPAPFGIAIAAVVLILGWRIVPGFWGIVGLGALAGAVCGVLILGPGFRLAMRVVAILDPIRTPEFTIEGTMFILVFLGVVFGGVFGIEAALLRRAFDVSGWVMSVSMTVVIMGLLLGGADLRSEFVDLGAGAWLNIPMFATVVFLYSAAMNKAIDRFGAKKASPAAQEPAGVQA